MWLNIENVGGLRQSDDKFIDLGMALIDIILNAILRILLFALMQFVVNGLRTAWGMFYMYIFYRDKGMRKYVLETEYMNNYVTVSSIGTMKIFGWIWVIALGCMALGAFYLLIRGIFL